VLSADGTFAAGFGLNVIGTVDFNGPSDPGPIDAINLINSMSLTGTLFGSPISFDETDILASTHLAGPGGLLWSAIIAPVETDDGLFRFSPLTLTASAPLDLLDVSDFHRWRFDTAGTFIGVGPRPAGKCIALTAVACPSEQLNAFFVAVPVSTPPTVLLALAGVVALGSRRRTNSHG
jgi:hypothetical protein